MSKGRRVVLALAVIALLAGVGIISCPYIVRWFYDQNAGELADEFDEWRLSAQDNTEEENILDLDGLYAAMQAYNEALYENGQSGFRDVQSYQEPSFDLTEWGLPYDMVGYIDIPRIGVKLPIYLGASTENMDRGAVHLSQTSLPIGGENTNAVIAAHRGYTWAEMFQNIEKLQLGDEITVTNLWETFTYRVAEIKVILPTDIQEVLIQEGRDLVTLITCHPLGYNYQRYVVYCERFVEGG